MDASWRPTAAAVSGITQPRASCAFHSSWRSGGRNSIANAASDESDASTAGTRSALSLADLRQPADFGQVSRDVGAPLGRHAQACQARASRNTRKRPRAPARCRTTRRRRAARTAERDPGGTSPARSRNSRIACTTPQKSNLSMFSFVKSSGGPRMTSLPRISIVPSRPASTDAAPGASLFCAMSAPAYTVR